MIEVTLTFIDGTEKCRSVYADEIHSLMGVVMDINSKRKDAPVSMSITTKDVLGKLDKTTENKS